MPIIYKRCVAFVLYYGKHGLHNNAYLEEGRPGTVKITQGDFYKAPLALVDQPQRGWVAASSGDECPSGQHHLQQPLDALFRALI